MNSKGTTKVGGEVSRVGERKCEDVAKVIRLVPEYSSHHAAVVTCFYLGST